MHREETAKVNFTRLDMQGETLSQRTCLIKTSRGLLQRGTPFLQNLLEKALPHPGDGNILLLRQNIATKDHILCEAPYAHFQTVFSKALLEFSPSEEIETSAEKNLTFP